MIMFRVVKISDVMDGALDEESLHVEDAFFFTIKVDEYYLVYDKNAEIIGRIPVEYNVFFRIEKYPYFEDTDMTNLLRMFNDGVKFELVGTSANSNKISVIKSEDIAKFYLVTEDTIEIPFTNQPFDSEGIAIFKNMNALADSLINTF